MKYLHLSTIRSIFNNVIKTNYRQSVLCAATTLMLLCFGAGEMWGYTFYLYTGQISGWDSSCNIRVWDGNSNLSPTNLGSNWYSFTTTNEGTFYFKRVDPTNENNTYDEFSCTINSTYNCAIVVDWKKGGYPCIVGESWTGWSSSAALGWDDYNPMTFNSSTKTFTLTSPYTSGTPKIKVKIGRGNADWTGATGTYSAVTQANVVSNSNDGDGNLVFTPAKAGNITISYSPSTNKISLTCAAPTITLNDEGGSGGSGTQNTYYGESSVNVSIPTKTGYNFAGYYTAASGGTQIINASGAWLASKSGYTSSATKWEVRADAELHAQWTEKTYNVTVASNNYSYGTIMSGQTTNQTVSAKHFTSDCSITAEAKTGYRFTGWTYSGSVVIADATATSTTIKATATGATVTANFEAIPAGQLDIVAGANGQVKKASGSWGSSASYTDITAAGNYNIYAQANAGYHFVNWTKSGDGSITTNAANGVYAMTANGTATVTANFAEDLRTLTPTVSYDHGSSTYTATSANQLGVATTSVLTASAPNAAHYTFAGWELTNLTVTNGTAATDLSITVKVTDPAQTCSAVAKYNEVLTTPWTIKGGTGLTENDWTTAYNMVKKTGYSTESVAYYTFHVSATNTGDSQKDSYGFKLLQGETWYGASADGDSYWVSATTSNIEISSSYDKNIQIRANVAGDYEIKVDYTTPASPKVSVTFPTSYTVNYGVSPAGAADAPTNDKSLSNGALVLSGTSVTFTKDATPNPGYTWGHWEKGGANVGTSNTYTTTIDAATTITAVYTEDMHTVTLAADDAFGTAHVTGGAATSGEAGIATALNITAEPTAGNRFIRWTKTGGTGTATFGDDRSANTTVTVTDGDVTITAEMGSNWVIGGDASIFGNWDMGLAHSFGNFATIGGDNVGYVDIALPANTTYEVKVYNHEGSKWWGYTTESVQTVNYTTHNNEALVFGMGDDYKNLQIITAGAGTYRFTWNETEKALTVTFPTSYTVTFGSSTGGTEVTASGSTSGSITTGQYVAAGEDVTFTQTPATGYTFSEWNTASVGSGSQLSTETSYTLSGISADKTVYAKYNTIPYTVSIEYKCGGTTLQTSRTIYNANVEGVDLAAPDIIGYSFTGWTAADGIRYGASYAGGTTTSSEAATTLYATQNAAITANYAEHKAVYFKNTLGWSEVYVTYDAYWDANLGTGNNDKVYHKMTRIGETDIYYDYIPSGYLADIEAWKYYIAFNSEQLGNLSESDGNYNNFDKGQVIFRKDFDSNATMFVPRTEGSSYTKNGATYVCSNYTTVDTDSRYADSYWMVYNSTESGYKLSINKTTDPWTGVNFDATTAGMSEFTATIELAAGQTYSFCVDKVTSVNTNNHWFANNITVTKDNCTNVEMYSNPSDNCHIATTAAGDYTFTLTCGNGRLFLSVDYPLSVGDYRLVYTHDGKSKPSDVIRANPGTESIVSFYIKKWYDKSTSSGAYTDQSLKLQRCTAVSPESWGGTSNEWDVTSLLNNETLQDTSGVYNFKVTQPAGGGTPTVTYEGGYTGNFYIRTDAADGGWNAYKDFADNRMTYSEYSEKNSNYSHYFMKYVTAGKNIKFCIANDYSQCISDTLEGDTYTGDSQTLPVNANIRYTWNHETNAITRAYIGASAASDFLRLHGNASNKLYTAATGDTYNTAVKFADDENWIYHVDVFAVPNTRIKLTANWNGHTQYFKGAAPIDDFDDADDDVLNALAPYLIGGSGSTRFKMRVIYDFKTNRLTTAWLPDGENITTDTEVSADLLVIRDADSKNAPSLFTLSASGKVSLIGHIVFALEMNPASIFDDSHTTYRNGLRSQLFQICLPYDVNVNDIYGLPGYGTKWVIQTYSGEMRAKLSWTPYIKDFWGTVRLSDGGIIKAGTGFVISHNLQYEDFRNAGGTIDKLYLYFPSVDKDGGYTINQPAAYGTTTYDELKCNHTGRESIDSDWRLTGLPGFYPAVVSTADPASGVQGVRDGEGIEYNHVTNGTTLNWLYEWGGAAGNYIVKNPKSYALNPTSAYFIQYHGSVTWVSGSYTYSTTPASVAAHRAPLSDYTNAQGEYIYSNEYVLTMSDEDGKLTDQAYVVVEPDATQGYTRNEDLGKSFAQNAAQIYTLSEGYQLAANTLPDTVTAVKVCLDMPSEGEYTIRLEKGGQFNHAVLEDLYTMTSTNLNTSEGYTFAAEAGRTEDRFVLRFAPQQPGTATDTETATAGTLRVTVIDGQIIVENGAKTGNTAGDMVYLYDAAGKAIYSTPFREGMTLPAPSAAGVYLVRLGSESRRIVVGK
ncbi:MAG: InlB B-repeat-containing protein [Paludibacteraceae bacterium]|nr:InlB B-repeat-containing protein [Paludibacteraceae bacterium]